MKLNGTQGISGGFKKRKERNKKKNNMLLPAGSRATIRRLSVQLVALTTLYWLGAL